MFRFLKDLVWDTGKQFQMDNCPQLAAAITYYVVFSLFPFLIFLTGVVGLVLNEEMRSDIVTEVLKQVPLTGTQGRNDVQDAIDAISGANARALGLIGFGALLWSSSSMFNAIRRALNIIYREPEYDRPWVQQKLVDLTLVLGLAVFFMSSVGATGALRIIESRSEDAAWLGDLSQDVGILWTLATYALGLLFSFVAFVVLYTAVPSRSRNLTNAIPGAIVAATLFELSKYLFGFYVTNFRNFDVVFGSLGAIVAFMFWVYVSSQIMLLGAEVTSVYAQIKGRSSRQPRLDGMGLPWYVKVYRAIRRLFVRDKAKPTYDQ